MIPSAENGKNPRYLKISGNAKSRISEVVSQMHESRPDAIFVTQISATGYGLSIKEAWRNAFPNEKAPRILTIWAKPDWNPYDTRYDEALSKTKDKLKKYKVRPGHIFVVDEYSPGMSRTLSLARDIVYDSFKELGHHGKIWDIVGAINLDLETYTRVNSSRQMRQAMGDLMASAGLWMRDPLDEAPKMPQTKNQRKYVKAVMNEYLRIGRLAGKQITLNSKSLEGTLK